MWLTYINHRKYDFQEEVSIRFRGWQGGVSLYICRQLFENRKPTKHIIGISMRLFKSTPN